MKRARTASALVLALGMAGALTACSQDSDESTESAPTTATSPAAAPTTAAPVASETAPPAPPAPAAPVLGPDGFGALTLGMDRDQAVASGAVAPFEFDPANKGCAPSAALSSAPTGEGTVFVSANLGVAAIEAYPGVETPEGIGIGSPVTAVEQAYPGWDFSDHLMKGWAHVPGNDAAYYRIAFEDGAVTEVTLQFVNQDCYE
jgi:hypothetical protein